MSGGLELVKKEFLTSSQTRPTALGSRLKRLRLAAAHSLTLARLRADRYLLRRTRRRRKWLKLYLRLRAQTLRGFFDRPCGAPEWAHRFSPFSEREGYGKMTPGKRGTAMHREPFQNQLRRSFIGYVAAILALILLLYLGGFALNFFAVVVRGCRRFSRRYPAAAPVSSGTARQSV